MNCPKCGYGYSTVVDCRTTGNAKIRRRECNGCGHRFTCYEVSAEDYGMLTRLLKQARIIKKILEEFKVC